MNVKIPERILFVDDDPLLLAGVQRHLRPHVAHLAVAEGSKAGLERVANDGPFAVIVSDLRMPGMGGIEFLAHAKAQAPETVRIMLTGFADVETAIQAVNEGAVFRFLTKPCPPETLLGAVKAGVEQYRLITAEKELLDKTLKGSIKLLTEILSMVDPESFGRAMRLRERVRHVLRNLDVARPWDLELAAMFSQIGYVTIPSELLGRVRAHEPLTADQAALLRRVPEMSQKLLSQIPRLESVARTVLYQNKHYDGSGFPEDSVAGAQLPFGARLLKILLDIDELEAELGSRDAVFIEIEKRAGWYDPELLQAARNALASLDGAGSPARTVVAHEAVKNLRIGDVLKSNVEAVDGRLLISAGNRISQALLQRIRNYASVVTVREPIVVERVVQG